MWRKTSGFTLSLAAFLHVVAAQSSVADRFNVFANEVITGALIIGGVVAIIYFLLQHESSGPSGGGGDVDLSGVRQDLQNLANNMEQLQNGFNQQLQQLHDALGNMEASLPQDFQENMIARLEAIEDAQQNQDFSTVENHLTAIENRLNDLSNEVEDTGISRDELRDIVQELRDTTHDEVDNSTEIYNVIGLLLQTLNQIQDNPRADPDLRQELREIQRILQEHSNLLNQLLQQDIGGGDVNIDLGGITIKDLIKELDTSSTDIDNAITIIEDGGETVEETDELVILIIQDATKWLNRFNQSVETFFAPVVKDPDQFRDTWEEDISKKRVTLLDRMQQHEDEIKTFIDATDADEEKKEEWKNRYDTVVTELIQFGEKEEEYLDTFLKWAEYLHEPAKQAAEAGQLDWDDLEKEDQFEDMIYKSESIEDKKSIKSLIKDAQSDMEEYMSMLNGFHSVLDYLKREYA